MSADPANRSPSAVGSPIPPPKTLETFDAHYANRIMLVLMGIVMVVLYIEGMLVPSLFTIQRDFGVDSAQASLIISVYAVSGVALSPVVGKLGDIYGKRKVLAGTMICYAAAVSVTGFSPTFSFMVVARTIQGVGLTIMPLGMSLMREEFPRELVPRAQGLLSAMFGIGFAISLPLGSFVSQNYGWRDTYHTAIPFVVLLTVLVIVLMRESPYRRPATRVDFVGAALLGGGLAAVVIALSQGEAWGWLSPLTVGFAVVGVALFVPFAWYEAWWKRLAREPIVDGRLLRERNVAVTNVVLTVAGLGMYLALFTLIYQFEYPVASGGYNAGFNPANPTSFNILGAGLDIIPLALSMTGVAVVASFAVSWTGVKPLALVGAVLTSVGFYVVSVASSLDQALLSEVIIGAGMALLNASIINLLVLTVDPRDMGQATAMNNVFRNVGGSVGAPIGGSLLSTYVLTTGPLGGLGIASHTAFQYAFWIASAVTLAGGLAILFGQEVVGPRRHTKFAHLPHVHRGLRRRPAGPPALDSAARSAGEAARPTDPLPTSSTPDGPVLPGRPRLAPNPEDAEGGPTPVVPQPRP